MPCLPHLFADRVIAVLHLIKGRKREFCWRQCFQPRPTLSLCNYIDDFSENPQAIWLGLLSITWLPAVMGYSVMTGSIDSLTSDRMKPAALEFVCHLVGCGNSKKNQIL